MSAPVPQANYAPCPNGYVKIGPGHYRRREDDPEAQAADNMIEHFREVIGPLFTALADCPFDIEEREKELERNRLDEIATLVRLLTYEEMMDLAAALWQMRPEGKEITEQELPGVWHRWSASK